MAWLTDKQIRQLGFASVGSNVKLSDKASYYNCKKYDWAPTYELMIFVSCLPE